MRICLSRWRFMVLYGAVWLNSHFIQGYLPLPMLLPEEHLPQVSYCGGGGGNSDADLYIPESGGEEPC